MKELHWRSILLLIVIGSMSSFAQNKPDNAKRQSELKKPPIIASQGSFFIGGESKALPSAPGRGGFGGGGDVTINQMYVQYQTPPDGDRHVPVVMVHGCCLSSKTW